MVKVTVQRKQPLGSVEFFGIPMQVAGEPGLLDGEAQRIVLNPPGVVRDTVVLAIQADLALGEDHGEVEGVRWEKQLATLP